MSTHNLTYALSSYMIKRSVWPNESNLKAFLVNYFKRLFIFLYIYKMNHITISDSCHCFNLLKEKFDIVSIHTLKGNSI